LKKDLQIPHCFINICIYILKKKKKKPLTVGLRLLLGIRNKGLLASEGWKDSRKQQGKIFCSI